MPDLVVNDTVIAVVQIVAAHLSDRLTTFTVANGDTVDRFLPHLQQPWAEVGE
jgi:hypothetical protein